MRRTKAMKCEIVIDVLYKMCAFVYNSQYRICKYYFDLIFLCFVRLLFSLHFCVAQWVETSTIVRCNVKERGREWQERGLGRIQHLSIYYFRCRKYLTKSSSVPTTILMNIEQFWFFLIFAFRIHASEFVLFSIFCLFSQPAYLCIHQFCSFFCCLLSKLACPFVEIIHFTIPDLTPKKLSIVYISSLDSEHCMFAKKKKKQKKQDYRIFIFPTLVCLQKLITIDIHGQNDP